MTVLHIVDAFTSKRFEGNPAAVCVLARPADETWMRLVAREMNLSETAFLHPIDGGYSLRWLTPEVEVALCGHATLASAFALWNTGQLPSDQPAKFFTKSGWLTCHLEGDWIAMDFPAVQAKECSLPESVAHSLGVKAVYAGTNGMDYLVELESEQVVRGLHPDPAGLVQSGARGVIVTAVSQTEPFDFISRFFAPGAGIYEDPVTGSAHCALGPYWQSKLNKSDFVAYQASPRGGVVHLSVRGDRVLLRGQAVMVARTEMFDS